jgi:hypothetical protein
MAEPSPHPCDDPDTVNTVAKALYMHTAWSGVSEHDGQTGHWIICYDCGALLGDGDELEREWARFTGHGNHREWCKGTSVPAYELALSHHQARAVLASLRDPITTHTRNQVAQALRDAADEIKRQDGTGGAYYEILRRAQTLDHQ